MFCSACGSEVAEGLRFCNRCGASLGGKPQAPPRLLALIVILSFAVAVVTVAGLLFMLVLGTEMMGRRDSSGGTYIFMIFLFLTVLGADALMVRQISRLLNVYLQTEPQPTRSASGSPPPRGGVASRSGHRDDEVVGASINSPTPELASPAGVETTALHTTAPDTDKVRVDTNEEELPTRKL